MAEINELYKEVDIRKDKIEKIMAQGINPYASKYDVTYTLPKAREAEMGTIVSVAGRIIFKRTFGKFMFIQIADITARLQVSLSVNEIELEKYEWFKNYVDTGDFVGIKGEMYTTKTGEITVKATEYTLLSKAMLPLPEKFHGVTDIELRYRQRYTDLIVNPEVKDSFIIRSKIISNVRKILEEKGYLEVETPILNTISGGATAKPFITHHNALNIDMYLRIALELNLKRLIVGGFDKVYEIGRVFRNEGMDISHNPEFTMLELYAAYEDFHDMMDITEELFSRTAKEVLGTTKIEYQGQNIDLAPGWKRITMVDSIKEVTGIDFNEILTDEEAVKLAKEKGIEIPDKTKETRGDVISLFFDEYVEKTLIQPTFIYEYPVEISPLAKKCPNNKKMTERFEVFICGREYGNAFSELNDPIDQYERFKKQVEAREAGDEEAGMMDEDYIQALEIGLPPTGGLGIGIDRMVMLLTNAASIRDVLLFPTMKPLS